VQPPLLKLVIAVAVGWRNLENIVKSAVYSNELKPDCHIRHGFQLSDGHTNDYCQTPTPAFRRASGSLASRQRV